MAQLDVQHRFEDDPHAEIAVTRELIADLNDHLALMRRSVGLNQPRERVGGLSHRSSYCLGASIGTNVRGHALCDGQYHRRRCTCTCHARQAVA